MKDHARQPDTAERDLQLPANSHRRPVLVGVQGAALRAAPAGAGLDADSAQDGIAIAAGIERDDVRPIAGLGSPKQQAAQVAEPTSYLRDVFFSYDASIWDCAAASGSGPTSPVYFISSAIRTAD